MRSADHAACAGPSSSRRICWSRFQRRGRRRSLPSPTRNPNPDAGPPGLYASGRTLKLFPGGDLFPIYIADPHRPTNTILVDFTRVDIEDTKSPRFRLSAGGRFGVLKIDPPSPGGRSWQISVDAGLDALFDSQNNQDAIGWDGNYGLTVATASGGPLAFKVGVLHTSAHMGDEYADRTGRQRHNYTREEVAVGFSARMGRRWRTYAETGVAYLERYEQQEPWRVQGGIEYESPRSLWGDRFSWFWASDLVVHAGTRLAARHVVAGRYRHALRRANVSARHPGARRASDRQRLLPVLRDHLSRSASGSISRRRAHEVGGRAARPPGGVSSSARPGVMRCARDTPPLTLPRTGSPP